MIIFYVGVFCLGIAILYLLIETAVKNGIVEANKAIEKAKQKTAEVSETAKPSHELAEHEEIPQSEDTK